MPLRALVINEQDNVANLIGPGSKNNSVQCTIEGQAEHVTVELKDDIPSNHKLAFRDITAGEPIIKYGLNIGQASKNIQQGEHVHVHNIESNRGRGDLES